MAGTIVNNMTALNNCENAGDWTGGTPTAYSGFSREGTNCIGEQASSPTSPTQECYDSITARDMSAETMCGWMWVHGYPESQANGGFSLVLGDGTNRAAFTLGGNDRGGFAATPVGWQNFIVSVPDKDDASAINIAGTTASIDDANITEIGFYFAVLTKALGNVDNLFFDVLWTYAHSGYALAITAGTGGSPATFSDLADWDASVATNRATGAFYETATGVFTQQAPVQIGDDGAGSSYFLAENEEVIFSDVEYINNHKFAVVGNSTGTNEAYFNSTTFRNVHATLTPTLNLNGGDIDTLEFDQCTFLGIDANFSNSADASGHAVTNSTFDGCAQIDPGDVEFTDDTFANTLDANGAIEIDADGTANISDVSFISDGTGHAVYISATGTYTLDGWTFSGYGSTGTSDAAIYNDSGGLVTLNMAGDVASPTYRDGSGASTTINNDKTVTFTNLQTNSEVRIYEAGTTTEVDGVENSGTSFQWTVGSGVSVDYVIHHVLYENIRVEGFSTTTSGSIPVQQRVDRNYSNP